MLVAGTGKNLLDEIRREFDEFIEIETRLAAERYSTAIKSTTWTRNVTIGILIFAICVGALVVRILGQAIARPLAELARGTKAIGSGDLDMQVKVRSSDEIGVLARAFNSMSLNLKTIDFMRQKAETSLEQSNRELEQRIDERTIKLKEANDRLMIEAESRQESEERVRLVLDSTGEAIYGLDINGNATFCNRACVEALGYERPGDLLGKNMHALIHHTRNDGSAYPVEECKIYRAFRLGEGTHVGDEVLWKADGSSFTAEYRSHPIRHDGQLMGSVVTFLDVTERKRVEAELRQKQSELTHVARLGMLGEMAAGLAHELNQPLTAVSALSEGALLRLERGKLPQNEFASVCKRIAGDAQRAGDIIRRLRNFVQKRKTERRQVCVNELLREVVTFVEADLRHDNIVLGCWMQDDLWKVEGDPIEIQQVVVNLIRNAGDALAKGDCPRREIVIETCNQESGSVEIVVSDSGPGIAPELADRVFDPFYTSKIDGLGIGLGICKSIIESHGGRIWVGQSSMGGASVHFNLPAQPQQGDMHAI